MTNETLDAPLLEHTDPSLARPLPPGLAAARADLIAAAHDLLAIPEAALTLPWSWIGGSEEEVRYGAYRAAEALEQAEIEARATVTVANAQERRAALLIGAATPLGGICTVCCCRLMNGCWTPTRGEASGRSAWSSATSSVASVSMAGGQPGGRRKGTT